MSQWQPVARGCRENPGVWDTGNGAIKRVEENPAYPGIERVTVSAYARGREYQDGRWYVRTDDPERVYHTSLRAARDAG